MVDSEQLRRALVQKLESLHHSGVRSIPRPVAAAPAAIDLAPVQSAPPVVAPVAAPDTPPAAPQPAGLSGLPTASKPAAAQPTAATTPAAFDGPLIPADERASTLQVISQEVSQCTLCEDLAAKRTQTVFGVGNPNARLVFFGEAPGADEDRVGEPFVGKAGQLLTKIIEACQLRREDVYILNVLKCRPPANRNPTPIESQNCRPFFERQLETIRPEVICCLGSIAATTLLETTMSVGRLRGKFHEWRGTQVAVTYHPAYLLRNPAAKKMAWTDMKMVMKQLGVNL